MAEFLLKPNEFQKQVDSFKAATDTVTTLKYELEKEGVSLNSIDKYAECVAAMNELIMSFGEFAKLDANSMQQIKENHKIGGDLDYGFKWFIKIKINIPFEYV